MKDDDILQLAHALRPELPTLLDDEAVSARFDRLIADADRGIGPPTELLDELAGNPITRRWMDEHRRDLAVDPAFEFGEMGFEPLPGQGPALGADEFVCPVPGCPSRWHRQRVGQQPPLCERHHQRLIPKP